MEQTKKKSRQGSSGKTARSAKTAKTVKSAKASKPQRTPKKSRKYKVYLAILAGTLIIVLIAAAVMGFIYLRRAYRVQKAHDVDPLSIEKIRAANDTSANKLMIVAHPDDESIWGGGHLQEGGYLVVTMTGGRSDTRSAEFEKAVLASGNTPLVLEYPDKVNGERDDWTAVYDQMQHDVDMLVSYKKWDIIATHNPLGEYGHQHHWMTSRLVADSCIKYGCGDKLYYFGVYHSKAKLPEFINEMTPITDEQLEFKDYILSFYDSQENTIAKFEHMLPYEMWLKADEVVVK